MDRHLIWLLVPAYIVLAVAFCVFAGRKVVAAVRRGPILRGLNPDEVIFREKFASGRSLDSHLSRIGGAGNCLTLTVTRDTLYTSMSLPLGTLGSVYDLEQRIAEKDIVSTQVCGSNLAGRRLVISFLLPTGATSRYEVRPKRYEAFMEAMSVDAA